jgi:hypothetical protein
MVTEVLYSVPVWVDAVGRFHYQGGAGGVQAWYWLGPCPISAEDGKPHVGCEEQWYKYTDLPWLRNEERRAMADIICQLLDGGL